MSKELLTILRHNEGNREEVGTQGEYRDTVQACSNGVRKTKAHPELNLPG